VKKILALIAVINLGGCAGALQFVANTYDRNDPCQTGAFSESERKRLGRPVGYQQPNWCGASDSRVVIYSTPQGAAVGNPVGYIKK